LQDLSLGILDLHLLVLHRPLEVSGRFPHLLQKPGVLDRKADLAQEHGQELLIMAVEGARGGLLRKAHRPHHSRLRLEWHDEERW
jgi:hypothetical protein